MGFFRRVGTTWEEQLIERSRTHGEYLAYSEDRFPVVAYGKSARNGDGSCWIARWNGGVWEKEVVDPSTRCHDPQLAFDPDGNPALAAPIVDDRPYVLADAAFAATFEMAVHAEDVLYRRTHVGLETREFETACQRVVDVMAETLGWDAERRVSEVTRAHAIRSANRAYREEVQ